MSQLIPPQAEATGAAKVEMLNFSKRFGSLQALHEMSMTIEGPARSTRCWAKTAQASRRS